MKTNDPEYSLSDDLCNILILNRNLNCFYFYVYRVRRLSLK